MHCTVLQVNCLQTTNYKYFMHLTQHLSKLLKPIPQMCDELYQPTVCTCTKEAMAYRRVIGVSKVHDAFDGWNLTNFFTALDDSM